MDTPFFVIDAAGCPSIVWASGTPSIAADAVLLFDLARGICVHSLITKDEQAELFAASDAIIAAAMSTYLVATIRPLLPKGVHND